MQTRLNKNLICSILCVDIVGHSRKLEFDQFHRKARLQFILQASLRDITENDRVILDTGDGAAIAFFGAPEDALTVALHIAEGIARDRDLYPEDPIELRSGIHLGPVRVMNNINGIVHFVGDGLNATQRIMSLARPGNTVVSRQYYDIVAPENQDAFNVLTLIGKRTDGEGREYELYIVGTRKVVGRSRWGAWRRQLVLRTRPVVRNPAMGWIGAGGVITLAVALLLPQMKSEPVTELSASVPAVAVAPGLETPAAASVVAQPLMKAKPKSKSSKAARHKPVIPGETPSETFAATSEPPRDVVEPSTPKVACSDAQRMLSKCS